MIWNKPFVVLYQTENHKQFIIKRRYEPISDHATIYVYLNVCVNAYLVVYQLIILMLKTVFYGLLIHNFWYIHVVLHIHYYLTYTVHTHTHSDSPWQVLLLLGSSYHSEY